MKLAFCLFKYFPYGGLQRDFLKIAQEALRRGHAVTVYTMKWEGKIPAGIKVEIIKVFALNNHQRAKKFSAKFNQLLKYTEFDLVIGFNKMSGLDVYYQADSCFAAKSRHNHNFWFRLSSRYRVYQRLEQNIFDRNSQTKILLLSSTEQQKFIHHYQTQNERFHLLPPGILKQNLNTDKMENIRYQLRGSFLISPDDFLLLMVGSGFRTKGVDRSIKAIASLPPEIKSRTHLFIIGKDNAKPYLALAKKLKLENKVRFLGGRDDVQKFLLSADLLLHPAYYENTGSVIVEAIAAGLPVLATDICGYSSHITKSISGKLIPSPFEQKHFNQLLINMLNSSEKNAWKSNALEYARTTDLYSLTNKALNFIETMETKL